MLTNSKLTIFHKTIDSTTKLEKWIRTNYDNVWFFGGKGAGLNKGYENANDVDVRIPYDSNEIDLDNIAIGDILVGADITTDIEQQKDLKGYEVFNITSINNNYFGNNPHLHLGGR